MAGVITDGVQWEHCNGCGEYVRLTNLGWLKPTAKQPHGLDLCVRCVDTLIRTRIAKFSEIKPAQSWRVTR